MADESYNDNVKTARGRALLLSKDELRWETLWCLTSKDASSPEKWRGGGGEEGENGGFKIFFNTVVLVILISFFSPAVIPLTVWECSGSNSLWKHENENLGYHF